MPSPFPGMDPYLEGDLWPDVHQSLAHEIRRVLAQQIWPRYLARVAIRFVADESDSQVMIGRLIPDVEVVRRPARETDALSSRAVVDVPVAPLVLPLPSPEGVKVVSVEIQDRATRDLVASIEVLSPVNKSGGGWDEYQRKRRTVLSSQAHLLEIDLLRRGRRSVDESQLPHAPYFVFLTRASARQLEIWPIPLRDRLPTVPVPLWSPDPAALLDLQAVLTKIYDDAHYEGDINYRNPPDPPLVDDEAQWAAELIKTQMEQT